jgi:heptaprenyl diphosphate synthase
MYKSNFSLISEQIRIYDFVHSGDKGMNENDNLEWVQQLKHELYERIHHPYLKKNIGTPYVDEDKLLVFDTMLTETDCSPNKRKLYIIAVMLVQIALDTHDTVSLKKPRDGQYKTNRQLTVLAGDYFSSLYYHLLAEDNEVHVIQLLSLAIQEINENKMALYQPQKLSLQQSFTKLRAIESGLLQRFAAFFELPVWKEFIGEYFLLKRLLTERKNILQAETTSLTAILEKSGITLPVQQEKTSFLLQLLDENIASTKLKVDQFFSKHPRFKSMIGEQIWHSFLEAGYLKQKIAEEG